MKRTYFTVTLTIFLCVKGITQTQTLPANRYKISEKDWTVTNLFLEIGLNQSSFLNQVYGTNKESGKLKPSIGYGAMGRYIFKSLFIEGGVFYSQFNGDGIKSELGLPKEYEFTHRGIEGSLNLLLFPSKSPIGFLKPYLGIGYQNSEMAITTKQSYAIGKDIYSSNTTSGILMQTGLFIMPVKHISINLSYKRTLQSFKENSGNTRIQLGFAYALNLNK
jgi:hypothetical protein